MEQWEKELREKLEKELPEGMYEIGGPGLVAWTGKGGKIDFEVLLQKACNAFVGTTPTEDAPTSVKKYYDSIVELKTFLKHIEEFHNSYEDNPAFEILDPPPHPADISKSVNEWRKEVLSVDEIIERYALTEKEIQELKNLQKPKE